MSGAWCCCFINGVVALGSKPHTHTYPRSGWCSQSETHAFVRCSLRPDQSTNQVRRISLDDKAKLKAFSAENDSAGWLTKKLFKKVRLAPRVGVPRRKKNRKMSTRPTVMRRQFGTAAGEAVRKEHSGTTTSPREPEMRA